MSTDQINITFECLDCGGSILELPDNPTDDSIAVCKSCRRSHGRYGDIKAKAMELAITEVNRIAKPHIEAIKRAFKGR
jgi:hypothetical protein